MEIVLDRSVDRFQSFNPKSYSPKTPAHHPRAKRQSNVVTHVVGSWTADEGRLCRTSSRLADTSLVVEHAGQSHVHFLREQ
jgi:hypothetical protein